MSSKTKIAAVALAVATLGATIALPTSEAQARGGWGLGAGFLAGTAVGIAATNSYAYGPSCQWVRQYNNGFYVGTVRVCNY